MYLIKIKYCLKFEWSSWHFLASPDEINVHKYQRRLTQLRQVRTICSMTMMSSVKLTAAWIKCMARNGRRLAKMLKPATLHMQTVPAERGLVPAGSGLIVSSQRTSGAERPARIESRAGASGQQLRLIEKLNLIISWDSQFANKGF